MVSLLFLLFSFLLLLLVCLKGDADLSTLFWEKFGTSLEKGLKGKQMVRMKVVTKLLVSQ